VIILLGLLNFKSNLYINYCSCYFECIEVKVAGPSNKNDK
jgi:hypothetical protein